MLEFNAWNWIIFLLFPFILFLSCFIISFLFWHIRHYIKGYRMKKRPGAYKNPSIFKRLLIEFPRRLSLDIYQRDPFEFGEYGLHMFCGCQGSGKTTAIVHKLLMLQKKYPNCKVRTNMNYANEDAAFSHWKDLVKNENGVFGQVEVIDEIQSWFSSNQSKDFPPEMLTEISQQRKQRKMLIGSAQVFSRIGKAIREQTTFVYLPVTLLGCLTLVRVSKPEYWNDEKQIFVRYLKHYFFVHTDEIRNSFDTYLKIEQYSKDGFKEDRLKVVSSDS